nr:putative reverse transcriptase domain-containing protein [Tanacetum cinerariifolium]
NNQNQQQPNKRQNIGRAYTARHGEKKHYGRSNPLCSKCYYHHDGPCAPKCHQCNRFGHLACECRSSTNANTINIQKGTGASQKATRYECGNQGHYRRDCLEQKNQNQEDQIKSTKARGVVGVHMDPAKVKAIESWATPMTPTEVRQFLGLAGYYKRFIEGFSLISKPPTKLTQKYFVVYCDASLKGYGVVLMQREKEEAMKGENVKAKNLGRLIKPIFKFRLDDRDSHFTSGIWRSLQEALGTDLDMSTAYHPQTDGQSERSIQTLEDMLRACVIDFG